MNEFADNPEIKSLLDKMDGIRGVLGSSGTAGTIPSVVVVGAQSHGKSTILEMICGAKLPSGAGMVSDILAIDCSSSFILSLSCLRLQSVLLIWR